MYMKLKTIFFFFLIPILIFACDGTASILVPAVVGDGSSLVNLSVRLIPGTTEVFVSTYPQTGTSTQISVEDAAIYAFSRAELQDCDAIVKIDTGNFAGFVCRNPELDRGFRVSPQQVGDSVVLTRRSPEEPFAYL